MPLFCRRPKRAGFSLIELVVVLFILAIVAGLTVAVVDWLRRAADKSSSSHTIGALGSNIQLYRTTFSNYPDQWDSLISSGGSDVYDKIDRRSDFLVAGTLDSTEVTRSLNRVGITKVMDHDPVLSNSLQSAPGNSGIIPRVLSDGANVALLNPSAKQGKIIIRSIYPEQADINAPVPPAGIKLLALGFGPMNTANGKTVASAPSYSGVGDPSKSYDRFIAVFAVYADGRRAQFKGVVDTFGDPLHQEISEFYDSTPE